MLKDPALEIPNIVLIVSRNTIRKILWDSWKSENLEKNMLI